MQPPLVTREDRSRDDRLLVDFPFYSLRNVSCPEDAENGRKVLFGHTPAPNVLNLKTDENVRDYLVATPGKKRRQYTQVHRAIRETLENDPQNFSLLNGGITIVARDYEVDEKKKMVRLLKPSIINGSQTQGVLEDYYREMQETGATPPTIHITFELIVTDDDSLIAETSIARNFQEDVMTISIAGRLGQLEDLEMALQRVYPEYKLRMSETQLSDDYIVTERLIQVMTALTPPELWPKNDEEGNPNKTYTYSAKTKCLRDFQRTFEKAKSPSDPEHEKYKDLYWFYLDIAPQAYKLHEKWKKHQGFIGTRIKAIKRDPSGRVVLDVPDGIVFPIFAALSAFVEKTPDGWRVVEPLTFNDEELINTAASIYKEIAASDPQRMGKNKACYSHLYQLTSLYKRLTAAG
jgi:hypothetical protein